MDVRILSLKRQSNGLVQSDTAALMDRVIYPLPERRAVGAVIAAILSDPGRSVRELGTLVGHFWHRPDELAKNLAVWWRALGLLEEVRDLGADHLHAHYATFPSTAAMFLADRLGLTFSFTSHAHDIFEYDHLVAAKLERAAFNVTISQFNRKFVAEHVPHSRVDGMRVVHCGVRPADFPYRRENRDPRMILTVGRLDEIKGFPVLLEACDILRGRGVDFQCTIIGEGDLRPKLEARLHALKLEGLVTLPGAMKQEVVREALYQAGTFVLPSVVSATGGRDGIPVALMEAMACGCPVVSTRVSGIPELIEHESTGLLATPGDANELADCLAELINNPDKAGALATQARTTIERDFDVSKEARKLYAVMSQKDSPH